jgi:hypothetical protein
MVMVLAIRRQIRPVKNSSFADLPAKMRTIARDDLVGSVVSFLRHDRNPVMQRPGVPKF